MAQKAGDPVLAGKDFLGVYAYLPIDFNMGRILGITKPTRADRGIFSGYSLPVFSADDEDLWGCICVPEDWGGDTDFDVFIGGWLAGSEDTKKFQLRVAYENWSAGDTVPATSSDSDVETDTGAAAPQYKSFKSQHTLSYSGVTVGDALGFQIYRLAATANEIGAEFVVEGAMFRYQRCKLGGAV